MQPKDLRNLIESYNSIYLEEKEECECEEEEKEEDKSEKKGKKKSKKEEQKESVEPYDVILSHLIDEGFASSVENAEKIMTVMSDEWMQSILDEGRLGAMADDVARTAGTVVGNVQRGVQTIQQKAKNVAGSFEHARQRASTGTTNPRVMVTKPTRSREFNNPPS